MRGEGSLVAKTALYLAELPEFDRCLGEQAVREAAQKTSRTFMGSRRDLFRLAEEALVRDGNMPREKARNTVRAVAQRDLGGFVQVLGEAVYREAVEEFRVNEADVEYALRYQRSWEWLAVWDDALIVSWPSPVMALAKELRPEHLACPWARGSGGNSMLAALVDRAWVIQWSIKVERGLRLNWRVETGPVLHLELRAWPELIEFLTLLLGARTGLKLRPDVTLEEVMAAGALVGFDTARLLRPFHEWLCRVAENLLERLVPALADVVGRRRRQWHPEGRYVVECLRERGLLCASLVASSVS